LSHAEQAYPSIIRVSSHLSQGEGEHKIADILRANPKKSCVIHGADADLILISMAMKNKITIMRETIHNDVMTTNYVDIDLLKELVRKELNVNHAEYVFLAIMTINGNDFLPHFPAFRVIERTLNTILEAFINFSRTVKYHKLANDMCDMYDINWPNYITFMEFFMEKYHGRLLMDWAENVKLQGRNYLPVQRPSKIQTMIKDSGRITNEISTEWYYRAFTGSYTEGKDVRKYISTKDKEHMFKSYAQGLEWTFKYYTMGVDAVNKTWYYPFHYTPFFHDMVTYLGTRKDSWQKVVREANTGGPDFVSLGAQLITILPKSSKYIAPSGMYPVFKKDSPISDLYPKSVPIQTDGMAVTYEQTIFLPFPNPRRMEYTASFLRGLNKKDEEIWFVSSKRFRKVERKFPPAKPEIPTETPRVKIGMSTTMDIYGNTIKYGRITEDDSLGYAHVPEIIINPDHKDRKDVLTESKKDSKKEPKEDSKKEPKDVSKHDTPPKKSITRINHEQYGFYMSSKFAR